LVLLSTNFPFTYTGGETMFIAPELPHLARAFAAEGVTVVPLFDSGAELPLPEGVGLDRRLATDWRRRRLLAYLRAPAWPGFLSEMWRGARQGGWVGAVRVWRWAAAAQAVWRWLPQALKPGEPVLLYTYWRGGATLAAARWAAMHPACAAVTRVHRYELYEDAFSPPFQPWTAVYARLDRVIPIAQHGLDHLRRFGVSEQRLHLARLGVPALSARTAPSDDGVLRLVSCSTLTPVKRVPFTAQALCAFARLHPRQPLHWTHFGDGPERAAVQAVLDAAPPNLQVTLAGRVDNAVVLAHYAQQPVDLFLLLSASEGLPVAIQEALAAGIPVLATAVGGVPEAVLANGDNGGLLPVSADEAAVARALQALLIDSPPAVRNQRRQAAWQHWATHFNAPCNHQTLANALHHLIRP
jgi:glycosyltransferase involved in cell wall biosynthesis